MQLLHAINCTCNHGFTAFYALFATLSEGLRVVDGYLLIVCSQWMSSCLASYLVPTGTLGDELSRSLAMLLASWVSPPLTPISCKSSLHVSCHVRFGLPHLLLPPSGVQSVTRLAGHDVGKHRRCPMNLLRLSATMSCRSPMSALDRSSSFVMWSFHDTPIMSRSHLLLNTLSLLFVWSVVLHVSLEQMAVERHWLLTRFTRSLHWW